MIAICLMALALAAADTSVRPIEVAVVAPRDVTDSMVQSICAEAEAIWASAGMALAWTRDASTGEMHRPAIEVTVDDRQAPVGRDGVLGWLTFTGDQPD